jgi:prepilin-type N-terminal cleavage/methylation domain-containing protein
MKHVSKGFTVVEIVVVIAVLVMLSAVAMIGFQNYAAYQRFDQSVAGVAAKLRETVVSARSSTGGTAHGVLVSPHSLTTFTGSTYNSMSPTNVLYDFSYVTLTPSFSDSGTLVVFENVTGLPSATGTILVVGQNDSGTNTLTISAGGIE